MKNISQNALNKLPNSALIALLDIEAQCLAVTQMWPNETITIDASIDRFNNFLSNNNPHQQKHDGIIFSANNSVEYYGQIFRIIGRTDIFWQDTSRKQSPKERLLNIDAVQSALENLKIKINKLNSTDRTWLFLRYKPNEVINSNLDKSIDYHRVFLREELKKGLRDTPVQGYGIFNELYSSSKKFKKNKSKDSFMQFTARELYSLFHYHKFPKKKELTLSIMCRLFPLASLVISNIDDYIKNIK